MPSSLPLDATRSQASFSVQLRILASAHGHFGTLAGELQPTDADRWRVRVRVDARDIRFDGPDWLARMTRSEKFLDVQHHPDITFVSDAFPVALLRTGGPLAGQLSVRGQRRQVMFDLAPGDCARSGQDCPIVVSGEVQRRDFGMTAYRLALRDRVGFEFQVFLVGPLP